jgi:hypothetical protein
VVADPDTALAESRRLPTVTLEGWRQFVNARPPTLKLIGKAAYEALGDAARADYDERRLAHHSELVTVETSTVRQIIQQCRLLMLLNQREISARRSLIIDGPWATGKSTTIKLLGRIHEQRVRRRHPDQDRIPVVYITTPPKGSPRKLASEFAHFLGLPDKPRYNTNDIADAVCQVLTQARTNLVIVDFTDRN